MKKTIFILFFIIMLISSSAGAKQSTHEPAKIQDIFVSLINQEPDPAEPGVYVDLRFKFDNNGSGTAENMQVELLPEYPFSLDPGAEAVKNIGTVQSMQRGDVGVIVNDH